MNGSIESILSQNEGKTVEFKENAKSLNNIIKTVVAFSNTAGGVLVVGVRDGTREVVGVTDVFAEEERIASALADSISPLLVPNLQITTFRAKHLLVIEVPWNPAGPFFMKRAGKERGTLIRLGSTNRVADEATIRTIESLKSGIYFDEMPCFAGSEDDLDIPLAKECLGKKRWAKETALSTKLLTVWQGRLFPTNGGVLLFGKEGRRQELFPDVHIRCGRFGGTTKATIHDQIEIQKPLPVAIGQIFHFIEKHTSEAIAFEGVRSERRRDFPPQAIREAVLNALVHADYSIRGASIEVCLYADRLEITNPGGLPFGLTLAAALGGRSRLRNPLVGRLFREMRFIEAWGSGLQRIVDTCRGQGLEDPSFREEGTFFTVTLFKASSFTAHDHTPIYNAPPWLAPLLSYLKEYTYISPKEAQKVWNVTSRTTSTRLKRLTEEGTLIEISTGPFDPYKKYALPR